MKNLIGAFILVFLFLVSCNNEDGSTALKPVDIYSMDFNDIKGTSLVNPVTIKIATSSGEDITDISQLQPNSLYHLKVKGSGADFYRIKSCDGFSVLENPSISKSSSEDFIFVIKTQSELAGELYVNIVPIHIDGEKILREQPQVFLLPG